MSKIGAFEVRYKPKIVVKGDLPDGIEIEGYDEFWWMDLDVSDEVFERELKKVLEEEDE